MSFEDSLHELMKVFRDFFLVTMKKSFFRRTHVEYSIFAYSIVVDALE
jgi:hypothetical protein